MTGSYHRPAIFEAHVSVVQLRPWPFVEVNWHGKKNGQDLCIRGSSMIVDQKISEAYKA